MQVIRRLYDEVEAMVERKEVLSKGCSSATTITTAYGIIIPAPYISYGGAIQVIAHKSRGLEYEMVCLVQLILGRKKSRSLFKLQF